MYAIRSYYGLARLSVGFEFFQNDVHLRIRQDDRLADLQDSPELLRQFLHFLGQLQRRRQGGTEGEHAVVGRNNFV